MKLDRVDLSLLRELQRNAQLTTQELGHMLRLSPSQAGRRRQRLESEGYVNAYVARLNAEKLGLSVQGFIQVYLNTHNTDTARSFAQLVDTRDEIISAWTMTGDADYLLRVFCEDLAGMNQLIHNVLLPHDAVAKVHSQIVMDQPKADSALPT